MNERDVIDYLRSRFTKPPYLQNWLDDDCEIIDLGDRALLVSVDTSSEKADFPTETPPEEIGYFSTALSLSDVAACGGDPLGVLVSCSIPLKGIALKNLLEMLAFHYTGLVTLLIGQAYKLK